VKRSISSKLTVGLIGAAAALAVLPAWADPKIAVVNPQRLVEESPQGKAVQESMRAEFAPRQRTLQQQEATLKGKQEKLQKDGATMTDDQRSREDKEIRDGERELQRKQTEANDDFNARRNEELSTLQKSLIEQVRTFAKQQNFDLVMADGVIYATGAVDITPQVLAMLQAKAPKTGSSAPLPMPKPAAK